IPTSAGAVSAVTRLVAARDLLRQRVWPPPNELLDRLIAYGRTHGAWDDARGYAEGSLARVVEAAAGDSLRLASAKLDPGLLCGWTSSRRRGCQCRERARRGSANGGHPPAALSTPQLLD